MHYFNYINALHGFSKNLRGPLFKFMSKIIIIFFTKNTKGRKDFWKVKEGHGQDFTVKQRHPHAHETKKHMIIFPSLRT